MITAWILSIIGLIVSFSGYRIFKKVVALWGFLLGGVLGALLTGMLIQDVGMMEKAIGFLIGGIVGAGLAFPLYKLVVFISGAILGLTLGNLVSNLLIPDEPGLRIIITLVLVFITGGMAMLLQKITLILSTALFGAALMLSGPLQAAGIASTGIGIWQRFGANQAAYAVLPPEWYVFWLIAALIGITIQFQQNRREE
jgi:hypothetical protein